MSLNDQIIGANYMLVFAWEVTNVYMDLAIIVLHFVVIQHHGSSLLFLFNSERLGVCKHSSNDLATVPEHVEFELRLVLNLVIHLLLLVSSIL